MTVTRLRPGYLDASGLAEMYPVPHSTGSMVDHAFRVADTVAAAPQGVAVAADLSCGDGAILRSISAGAKFFGDLAPGYPLCGPIAETIHEIPPVDLFVCCETLEHLDDPHVTLAVIRRRARQLLLSTPVDAWGDDNPEHFWAWDRAGVEEMLAAAGWKADSYTTSDHRAAGFRYCFGIWVASWS
jgi:hypothetical protein